MIARTCHPDQIFHDRLCFGEPTHRADQHLESGRRSGAALVRWSPPAPDDGTRRPTGMIRRQISMNRFIDLPDPTCKDRPCTGLGLLEHRMQHPRIGFVGFGEAARCFAAHMAAQGVKPILAYCHGKTNRPPYPEAFVAQAAECAVTLVDRLEDLSDVDVVFSAVVVAAARTTGEAIAGIIQPGALVVDINASTPATKKRVAQAVEARGGEFADANLMGAVSLYGASVPLYTSGSGAARFAGRHLRHLDSRSTSPVPKPERRPQSRCCAAS